MAWCVSCENSSVLEVGDMCTQCKDAERTSMEEARAEYVPKSKSDEELIRCACDDGDCSGKEGVEGEVSGHLENCSCSHCHRVLGKL